MAIPSDEQQKKAEIALRAQDKEQYAATTADARAVAARYMLKQSIGMNTDPLGTYVVLREARDMACAAGDFATASEAIDALAAVFSIKAAPMRLAALTASRRAIPASTPATVASAVADALSIAEEACAADDDQTANDAMAMANAVSSHSVDARLTNDIHARSVELATIRSDRPAVVAATTVLESSPADPAANSTVGRFNCLIKGRWELGLPLLVKGLDPVLKDLAARDLAHPTTAATQIELADGGWKLGQANEGIKKQRLRERACFWYLAAQPTATGPAAKRIVARMTEAGEAKVFAVHPTGVTDARRVALVCDASGSMINKMAALKNELVKAVNAMTPDMAFSIIFFQAQQYAALDKALIPANVGNKRRAQRFLDKVTTTGETHPIPSLELAFKQRPQIVWLLTDGDFPNNDAVLQKVRLLNKDHSVQINTIAFVDAGDTDTAFLDLLKQMAAENHGVFKRIDADRLPAPR